MFSDEAREFLAKPLTARLATINPDGSPHVVPLWFKLEGDDIIIISERKTAKVRNLKADPRAALNVGGDPATDKVAYMIRGEVSLADDTDHYWTNRLTHHYESPEEAEKLIEEWKDLDMVYMRLKPSAVLKVWEA
jgi:PPOX class probable F420-dependent enzyme